MQVVVPRSNLTMAANEVVNVVFNYEDAATIVPASIPAGCTIFSLDNSWITGGPLPPLLVLTQGWREPNKTQILSYEATARINTAFPDYSQANANAEVNKYLTTYGANTTTWPTGVQARLAEINRCWTYVNAVRQSATGLATAALPADPSDNSHWPAIISPYVPLP